MTLNKKELRTKTRKEIVEIMKRTEADIKKATTDVFDGAEKNLRKPRQLRKDFARIKTILMEVKDA